MIYERKIFLNRAICINKCIIIQIILNSNIEICVRQILCVDKSNHFEISRNSKFQLSST